MKYYIYNKLSKSGYKKTSSDMLDVSFLSEEFFLNLKSSDEVELHGGDGTVNNFINRCVTYPQITLVKSGTGNDLARSLQSDYQDVCIFAVNGTKFLNGFDVGLGAIVCDLVEKDKMKGRLSYFRNVFRGLKIVEAQTMELIIDGKKIVTNNTLLITAQNAKYFGGGMKVTPLAEVQNDSLEVCVMGNGSKRYIASIFPTIFIGQHLRFKKNVQLYRGNQIEIRLSKQVIGECDGEIIAPTLVYNLKQVGTVKMRTRLSSV